MNCPRCGNGPIEPGPNRRVRVELAEETVEKLVCEDCAKLFMVNIT